MRPPKKTWPIEDEVAEEHFPNFAASSPAGPRLDIGVNPTNMPPISVMRRPLVNMTKSLRVHSHVADLKNKILCGKLE